MIATRDVAAAAAAALQARDWDGFVVRELLGPRDLSYAEVTGSSASGSAGPICGTSSSPTRTWRRRSCRPASPRTPPSCTSAWRRRSTRAGRLLGGRSEQNTTATPFEQFAVQLARIAGRSDRADQVPAGGGS